MRWQQDSRLAQLAKKIGWAGDVHTLAEFLEDVIGYMPKRVQDLMRKFYLDDGIIERKEETGNLDSRSYQILSEGRITLSVLSRLTVQDLETLLQFKREGRW